MSAPAAAAPRAPRYCSSGQRTGGVTGACVSGSRARAASGSQLGVAASHRPTAGAPRRCTPSGVDRRAGADRRECGDCAGRGARPPGTRWHPLPRYICRPAYAACGPQARRSALARRAQVRPYLMADGGNVEFVEIDGLVVKLRLKGACGSCPSSLTTMTMGIKRRLMEKIPVSPPPAAALVAQGPGPAAARAPAGEPGWLAGRLQLCALSSSHAGRGRRCTCPRPTHLGADQRPPHAPPPSTRTGRRSWTWSRSWTRCRAWSSPRRT
jgi:Fe-S cluster biogenesis protein NfuA